jgi:hypothetical protein
MKQLLWVVLFGLFLSMLVVVNANGSNEPMILRNIESATVAPEDTINMGFGVYEVSAQYNIGGYSNGWIPKEGSLKSEQKLDALWIESRTYTETDIVLIDGAGNERKVYLSNSNATENSNYAEYFWIAEDGSSYYAHSSNGPGWPDLTYEEAFVPEHLARESLSPDQKNPEEEEPINPGIDLTDENSILIKGQLVDEMTGKVIPGATLNSAYEFSPEEVVTDGSGNFEFAVSSEFNGQWNFHSDCYGWADAISIRKNNEEFTLTKNRFDAENEIIDTTGLNEVDIGKLYAWPSADISTISDLETSFNVQYKYKNREGYNGPGQGGYRTEHYLSSALPLDYDVFIQFEDEQGNTHESSAYHIPKDAKCGVITLKYFNGESEWSFLDEIQPDEETGPIEIPEELPEEVINNLCQGCLKRDLCYPLGYRKGGEYCSEDKAFISQLKSDSSCENNFECESNVCIDSECISGGLLKRILNWFRRLFS